jgi:hypothetical protein
MRICFDLEDLTMTPETTPPLVRELPQSALGPDGKIIPMTDEERRAWCERARATLAAIAEMPDDDDEPPDAMEQMMRGIDEHRPHRPLFQGMY